MDALLLFLILLVPVMIVALHHSIEAANTRNKPRPKNEPKTYRRRRRLAEWERHYYARKNDRKAVASAVPDKTPSKPAPQQAQQKRSYTSPTETPREPGKKHAVAAQAMQNAGSPGGLTTAPVDIGMVTYAEQGGSPTFYRERRIPDTVAFARPCVILRTRKQTTTTMRFELIDGQGVQHFISESAWTLTRGETLVTSETWFPVDNLGDDPEGEWSLRVYDGEQLMAIHTFKWRDDGGDAFRGYLESDGEISSDLITELSDVQLAPLSLDDLLSGEADGMLD